MSVEPLASFIAPHIQWSSLVPLLIIFGTAIVGVLVEAFVPGPWRRTVQIVLFLLAQVAALTAVIVFAVLTLPQATEHDVFPVGTSLILDQWSIGVQGILLVASILASLVMIDRTSARQDHFAPLASAIPGSRYEEEARLQGVEQTELFPLTLFAIGGMLVFPASNDYLTMFVALEVLSLPLYAMTAMARRRRLLSQEASFKYFTLGAFSSAIFLFGVALIYGYSGQLTVGSSFIAAQAPEVAGVLPDTIIMYYAGVILVAVGILFKIGAVPFHAWTPDVYQGAPTPITGLMAACTKIAAIGVLVRFLFVGVYPLGLEDIKPLLYPLWGVAILTMLVGAIIATTQTDMKRMLAYSSIAHAGFLLIPLLGPTGETTLAIQFYLLVYAVATIGAFAVVTLVRETTAQGEILGEATHIGQWAGLGRRSPFLAAAMSVFLLSFAGLPLTAGFIAKYQAFSTAVGGDAWILTAVGIGASAISLFFYIRVMVLMFFVLPAEERTGEHDDTAPRPNPSDPAEVPDDTLHGEAAEPAGTPSAVLSPARTAIVTPDMPTRVAVVQSQGPALAVIGLSAAFLLIVGVFPTPILDVLSALM
ncbi:NADH-quinone oxidoreductase subunit NuoN [Jonesia quinghaiensis]|uniref:NADH-quinone oxidoreductase subunit NuoN n=1 Tax=Jonesia quinghaiensis TaxID=262806 RepID=UPI0004291332|nr:NADH-quinone oxidoreductase subunit NuoN [Jonesia quinghaiensis]